MHFTIQYGIPEIDELWKHLQTGKNSGSLAADELKLYKKLFRTFYHLGIDPKYPSLHSHKIDTLSTEAGFEVFESYIENDNPKASRVFWAYGPRKGQITILAIEDHPNNKREYKRIHLSNFPINK